MLNFKDIVDAIIDLAIDPTEATLYVAQATIQPIVDYRLGGTQLHFINFNSNDYLNDVVNLQELVDYVDEEGLDLSTIEIECIDFEVTENKILLFC